MIERRPFHVLVLNDNQEILDLLQELLRDEGYLVTTSHLWLWLGSSKHQQLFGY